MTVGILYIGIGKYVLLWNDFIESAEKYLCNYSPIQG